MTDVLTPEQRSRNMAAIRSRNTRPEIIVRSALHAMGFRFRLHRSDLPGKPDLVLPRYGTAIFVHGCFWHMHNCRYGRPRPSTNSQFWEEKRKGNVARDRRNVFELKHAGWRVFTIWECETRDPDLLRNRLLAWQEELRFIPLSRSSTRDTFELSRADQQA
ncbi:MAG TPA: very short patch repair endonuclease [Bryobacteraceae bacterium]|nr:very short patch repair endonuclease [Bryobacteraceae bacterium]